MKKIIYLIIILFCLTMCIAVPVSAHEKEFSFELSVDGKNEVEVKNGDIITVSLRLKRDGDTNPYAMYAMQDEIRYDSTFFELVEGSENLNLGVETMDIAMVDRYREFYMNYLSMSGGTQWDADTLVGSFQLKIIGDSGVSKITNQDFLVSLQDGSGSYLCDANELTVILSTECVVRFMTNGGSEIEDQIVQYGEKMKYPKDPKRKGYKLEGWYTDINLTNEWDFENDVVYSNMSLYAKWVEAHSISYGMYMIAIVFILVFVLFWMKRKKNNDSN